MSTFEFICFNTAAYALHRALLLVPKFRPAAFFTWIFLFLSFPCGLVFGLIDHLLQNRMYERRCHDLRKMRVICDASFPPIHDMSELNRLPPEHLIKMWGLDCHKFVDEFGDFDLCAWREHEFEKLGL